MEKIKVISINPVAGKKFESVKLSDGRSATVWDGNDGNKNLANAIRANLNLECEAELKTYNGAQGVGYNIRAFSPGVSKDLSEFVNETPIAEKVVESNVPQCPGNVPMSIKDQIISADVILKCATELTTAGTASGNTMGEQLADAVNELTGAFKLALSNVKAL